MPQPLGNGLGRVLRHAGKQEGEFIATDTGDEIVLLDGLAKQGGKPSERFVAGGGAVFAVDLPEMVDIQQRERGGGGGAVL